MQKYTKKLKSTDHYIWMPSSNFNKVMEGLLKPGVQEAIFKKAFDYVNGKHGKVNLETCLAEMYNKKLDEDYIVCVCLACISLIESGKDDFEKIEEGLSEKMKKSVMRQVGEQLSSCDDINKTK